MKTFSWFFRPRTIWWPTLPGWLLIFSGIAGPLFAWWAWGESYLSHTHREASEILVVEGWVGSETLEAAAKEFALGGYRWIVAAGGPNGERWNQRRWTHAEIAENGLVAAGIERDKIIRAPARDVETQRTYESALAVRQTLDAQGLRPSALTIFTRGSHGRRSRLVYAKVFGSSARVGVVSWLPEQQQAQPWWHSTTRAKDLLTETIGCLYEMLLDSGRKSTTVTSPAAPARQPAR